MRNTIIFILTVLLFTAFLICQAEAGGLFAVGSFGAGAYSTGGGGGGDCPDRTYLFYWDGNHSTSSTTACFDSGGTEKGGTLTGGSIGSSYGESGNGFGMTDADDRILWTVTSAEFAETHALTIYMRVRVDADVTDTNLSILELYDDDENYVSPRVMDTEYIRTYWEGTNVQANVEDTSTFTRDGSTWYTFSFSASPATAGTDLSTDIDGGASWYGEDDDLTAMATEWDSLVIGNYIIYATEGDPIDIDKVEIIEGFEAANPW